jgi:hypothetical protein
MMAKRRKSASLFILHACKLLLLACSLLLLACNSSGGRVRIEGKFRHMNQAELYLLDLQHGQKDTITVRDGRFVFETSQKDSTTYLLMFPNFSVIPVFTQPGATVKVEGDASHLRGTKIRGTDENDEMTNFRLNTASQTPPETKASARKHILDNPGSPVSRYLLEQFFLRDAEPDYAEVGKMADAMLNQNAISARQHKQLKTLGNAPKGSKLPPFTVRDTKGKTVTTQQLQSQANVICLWSSWHYESKNIMTQLRKMQKEHPGSISVVSVCIDATEAEGKEFISRDSISWPNVCDGKMWDTPLAQKLGFVTLPANVIADKNGKIVARNASSIKEMKKSIEDLLEKK